MYVGRSHTATVTTKNLLPFTCVHCGHKADALVLGIGRGGGQSPFMLDESGAKDRAASSAESASRTNAIDTLKMARCPSCQRRDEGAVSKMRLKFIAMALAIVVLFPIIGMFIGNIGLYIFVPTGVITACIVFWANRWRWQSTDRRVAFMKPD